MNSIDEAHILMKMAQKDFKAMQGMKDAVQFDEEIFGFHAQQAVEKILKAWLTILGGRYPRTHDLSLLFYLLEEKGTVCTRYLDLVELNAFAVQFRYNAFDMEYERLDRPALIGHVEELMQKIEQLINKRGKIPFDE